MYQRLNNIHAFGPFSHPQDALPSKPRRSATARKPAPVLRAICADTALPTPDGPLPADVLAVGDHLVTCDGTRVRITRITRHTYSQGDLARNRHLAPIRIEPDAFTGLSNATTLLVSPDLPLHPMHGSPETLPASALYDGCMIRPVTPEEGITYIQIDLDAPATLNLDGLPIRLGEPADAPSIGPSPLGWTREEKRVFRPIA